MNKRIPFLVVLVLLLGLVLSLGTVGYAKGYTIGLAVKSLTNPAYKALADAAQETADELGVELIVLSSQAFSALEEQIQQVEDLIEKGVDAIGITCVDSRGVIPVIEDANRRGIPILTVDTGADGGEVATFIATDNLKAGKLAGQWMIDQLLGSGKVAMIEGTPGSQQGRDRKDGFHAALAEAPGIRIVASIPANFERAMGMQVMEDILTSNPDLDGVFAANDEMAMGALEALKQRNLAGKVVLLGMNGSPDALEAVYRAEMQGTVVQYMEYVGEMFVRSAVRIIEGEKLPEYIDTGVSIADTKFLKKMFDSFNVYP